MQTSAILPSKLEDPNREDRLGFTPLLWAVQNGDVAKVKSLLKANADVNARDSDGQTALHFAVDKGYIEIVKLLLEHKCDVNQQDKFLHTALHRAAALGQTEIVQLLLQQNADVEITNQGQDVNIPNKDGWAPLHCCCVQGYADLAKILLQHGADINYQSKDGNTPLHIAAEEGKAEVAEVLVKYGANTSLLNSKGKKPEGNSTEISEILKSKPEIQSANATVSGDGLKIAEAGKQSQFILQGVIVSDVEQIQVVFNEKGTRRMYSFNSKVIDNKNGSYTIIYTPQQGTRTGIYNLLVSIMSTPVAGSPIEVAVYGGLIHNLNNLNNLVTATPAVNPRTTSQSNVLFGGIFNQKGTTHGSAEEIQLMLKQKNVELQQQVLDLQQEKLQLQQELIKYERESLEKGATTFTPVPQLICEMCKERARDTVVLPCLHFKYCKVCLSGSECPFCKVVLCGYLRVKT